MSESIILILIIYIRQQVTCRELGRQKITTTSKEAAAASSYKLPDTFKFEQQYRITVSGSDACGHVTHSSSYVTVPKPAKDQRIVKGSLVRV